jgi:hypothetical protein
MIFGRWEVRIARKDWVGGSIKICRLHSLNRAEERAKYLGGWVVDRKMWRSW